MNVALHVQKLMATRYDESVDYGSTSLSLPLKLVKSYFVLVYTPLHIIPTATASYSLEHLDQFLVFELSRLL